MKKLIVLLMLCIVIGLQSLMAQTQDTSIQKQSVDTLNQKFDSVEVQPEFPGGDEARIMFLRDNLRYPNEAIEKDIQGTVFVTFIVERDGGFRILRL